MTHLMTPEHKVMIYQSLLKETEDAAVTLITKLIGRLPGGPESVAAEFMEAAGDGIDPLSKIMRRTAQSLTCKVSENT